ncbi:unnamed protein product, partial [Echinostoma caproni]|uniref:DUF4378 domain-containing protein n=1 Tax=Echinostoma caproni TaxID=27848 RepID=A0A183B6D9_9TREM
VQKSNDFRDHSHDPDPYKDVRSEPDVIARNEPSEPSVKNPPEVDSPPDTDSLSDTAEASLSLAPSLFSVDNVRGLVADVPHRIQPLIRQALDYFWQARVNAPEGSREPALTAALNTPPAQFLFDAFDEADLSPDLLKLPTLRFVSRRLLFDLVCECMQQVYAGEDHEFFSKQTGKPFHPRVSSSQFRLWQGRSRPVDKEHLSQIVSPRVQEVLGPTNDKPSSVPENSLECTDIRRFPGKLTSGKRFSRLAQWTLSKKSSLDRLLELELRADESSWLSYVPEEQQLKKSLSDQIWNDLFQEALDSMIQRWNATHSVPQPVIPSVELAT